MNVGDLMTAICSNETEGLDGFTNLERSIYICDTFECDDIDLLHTFDYTIPLNTKDVEIVLAAYHLSRLQAQFFHMLMDDEEVTLENRATCEIYTYYMHLTARRLENHYLHLTTGADCLKETFIN